MTTTLLRTITMGCGISLALGGLTAPQGCADEPETGLRFYDASEGCGASQDDLSKPVATGATLAVRVEAEGTDEAPTLDAVIASDPEVMAVAELGNPVSLEARAAGFTAVEVRDDRGRRGEITLEVADPARADIRISDLQPVWDLDVALEDTGGAVPSELAAGGLALAAGGRLGLDVTLQDAEGRDLIGFGAAGWSASPPDAVTFEPQAAMSDAVWVEHLGVDGAVVISAAAGGELHVTLTTADADRLAVYSPERDAIVEALTLAVGDKATVVLVAFDADDRIYLGNGPGGFHAEFVDGSTAAVALVSPPWAAPEGDIELDDDAVEILEASRVVYVSGEAPGAATLRLTAAGRSLDLPVTVTQ